MPGTVVRVEVNVGDRVAKGQVLVVIEAMKMEHRIAAPADGVVAEVRVGAGDSVDNNQVLVVLSEGES
jgi:propionyl-CoA carboxylase alpha chain